jgi:glutamyl-tRNA synthetase
LTIFDFRIVNRQVVNRQSSIAMVFRFRFAPSPTGAPHVGNLHTALFSWALARALGGDFILRIEDSDAARNTPQAAQALLEALAWIGLDWDEGPDVGGDYGPYVQSERLSDHQQVMAQLLDGGYAYYGDDPDRPAAAQGNPLRLRMPRSGQTILHDAIRGEIIFDNARLPDPILVRSDGRPLYHLAAMADDHAMAISHVVRGEEWLSSAPIHVQLYRALGWPEPVWIHLPLVLNRHGQKLKKRDPEGGYLVSDFQQAGYLPAALFNYLLLLGWAPDGVQEIVDKWMVRKQLRLERLSAAPAIFDWDKLNWLNRRYLRRLSDAGLAEQIQPYLEEAYGPLPAATGWLVRLTAVIRDELVKLEDAVELAEWAFIDEFEVSENGRLALASPAARPVLLRLIAEVAHVVLLDGRTAQSILNSLRDAFAASDSWSARDVLWPIRAALTGHTQGPALHEIMGLLGKQRTLQRLGAALR